MNHPNIHMIQTFCIIIDRDGMLHMRRLNHSHTLGSTPSRYADMPEELGHSESLVSSEIKVQEGFLSTCRRAQEGENILRRASGR